MRTKLIQAMFFFVFLFSTVSAQTIDFTELERTVEGFSALKKTA